MAKSPDKPVRREMIVTDVKEIVAEVDDVLRKADESVRIIKERHATRRFKT